MTTENNMWFGEVEPFPVYNTLNHSVYHGDVLKQFCCVIKRCSIAPTPLALPRVTLHPRLLCR